jgi:hypothetical protein
MRKLLCAALGAVAVLPSPAIAQHTNDGPNTIELCNGAACYVYYNFGTLEDPSWIMIESYFREYPGEPNVN